VARRACQDYRALCGRWELRHHPGLIMFGILISDCSAIYPILIEGLN
jgi:hypothetical protein